jgi:hypothetical protein
MKLVTVLCTLVFLAALGTLGQDKAQMSEAAKPISNLAWLVGGVWTADASKMGGGMQRIETRYEWSDNHSFLRFNTHFVTDKATLHNYDGQFFWDPDRGTLGMWYMNARNEITQGTITVKGDVLDFAFRGTDFEGKLADLKVQVTRKNNDRYVWQLAEKGTEGWKALASLEYVRGS